MTTRTSKFANIENRKKKIEIIKSKTFAKSLSFSKVAQIKLFDQIKRVENLLTYILNFSLPAVNLALDLLVFKMVPNQFILKESVVLLDRAAN